MANRKVVGGEAVVSVAAMLAAIALFRQQELFDPAEIRKPIFGDHAAGVRKSDSTKLEIGRPRMRQRTRKQEVRPV